MQSEASDLKELGIPMGPRVKILKLFAADPTDPTGQRDRTVRRATSLFFKPAPPPQLDSLANSGKKYGCFLSHHKAACAMEGETELDVIRTRVLSHSHLALFSNTARFLKEKLEGLTKKDAFLDSDDLRDLNTLTDHVRDSVALVVIQSAELLQRPWCLLEVTPPSTLILAKPLTLKPRLRSCTRPSRPRFRSSQWQSRARATISRRPCVSSSTWTPNSTLSIQGHATSSAARV